MSSPRASLARRRSERLARRALGFTLDAELTDAEAAQLLVDLSERDPTLLRLARALISQAAVDEPVCRRATEVLALALSAVEAAQPRVAARESYGVV